VTKHSIQIIQGYIYLLLILNIILPLYNRLLAGLRERLSPEMPEATGRGQRLHARGSLVERLEARYLRLETTSLLPETRDYRYEPPATARDSRERG
jgi:hypothetical protein